MAIDDRSRRNRRGQNRSLTSAEWAEYVAALVADVYKQHPRLADRRAAFPWLHGHLGDHSRGVWFLGWYPALAKAANVGAGSDPNLQWRSTLGDQLFRIMLTAAGFKSGDAMSGTGWNCYITNLIKRPIDVGRFRQRADQDDARGLPYQETARYAEYKRWSPVLRGELERAQPRLIVAMGAEAAKALQALATDPACSFPDMPPTDAILHYATFNYAESGGEFRTNVEKYIRQFRDLRSRADALPEQVNVRDASGGLSSGAHD